MTASDVVQVLSGLERHGIEVWLNGGWGVDALLGHQTREHEDLDITISTTNGKAYTTAMQELGFNVFRVDNGYNWLMVDSGGRLVDVHLVDFSETSLNDVGVAMYGPNGLPFEVGSLDGTGRINGKTVKCETADFQVRGHTTYRPDATDYRDVLALCTRFSIDVPEVFRRMGFHSADLSSVKEPTGSSTKR